MHVLAVEITEERPKELLRCPNEIPSIESDP
jgi:hypothetical protein